MTETRPDHDAQLEICGETYLFTRSHDLLRRMEQRFGALIPLAGRVERMAVTQAELVAIYEEILKGDQSRPWRLALERWVWDIGTPKLCAPLARVLYELPIGNKTLRLIEEEKRITAQEQRDAEAAARPTSPPDRGPADPRIVHIAEAISAKFAATA